ncbi:hypothetical protein SGLAU_00290 [Streptomyces glaucescens]|uniref:Uncharacterized protein n=1 Tax=Streptomyces glaucescens TaxID=1907 RepID=A0A089X2T3_STRGA|nr:hypothetical protein SGLAU_00290 [Streptomyces glaucescens]
MWRSARFTTGAATQGRRGCPGPEGSDRGSRVVLWRFRLRRRGLRAGARGCATGPGKRTVLLRRPWRSHCRRPARRPGVRRRRQPRPRHRPQVPDDSLSGAGDGRGQAKIVTWPLGVGCGAVADIEDQQATLARGRHNSGSQLLQRHLLARTEQDRGLVRSEHRVPTVCGHPDHVLVVLLVGGQETGPAHLVRGYDIAPNAGVWEHQCQNLGLDPREGSLATPHLNRSYRPVRQRMARADVRRPPPGPRPGSASLAGQCGFGMPSLLMCARCQIPFQLNGVSGTNRCRWPHGHGASTHAHPRHNSTQPCPVELSTRGPSSPQAGQPGRSAPSRSAFCRRTYSDSRSDGWRNGSSNHARSGLSHQLRSHHGRGFGTIRRPACFSARRCTAYSSARTSHSTRASCSSSTARASASGSASSRRGIAALSVRWWYVARSP